MQLKGIGNKIFIVSFERAWTNKLIGRLLSYTGCFSCEAIRKKYGKYKLLTQHKFDKYVYWIQNWT